MRITISPPGIITSRLMAGLRLPDNGTISIEYGKRTGHRQHYRYFIDLPDGKEYESDELSTGAGHSLQSALENLLAFLGAAAESYAYDIRRGGDGFKGENSDLFPRHIVEWAHQNSDEISCLQCELQENKVFVETPDALDCCIVADTDPQPLNELQATVRHLLDK